MNRDLRKQTPITRVNIEENNKTEKYNELKKIQKQMIKFKL